MWGALLVGSVCSCWVLAGYCARPRRQYVPRHQRSTAGVLGFWPVDQDNTGARRTEHVELAAHLGDRSVQRGMARGSGVNGALHRDVDTDGAARLPVEGGDLEGVLVVAGDDSRCHAHQFCPTRRPSVGVWQ